MGKFITLLAAAALIVHTGLIAVITQTNPTLIVSALVVGVLGIAALVVKHRDERARETRRAATREGLGALIEEGRALMLQCSKNQTDPAPQTEIDDWASRAEAFLIEHLSRSRVARFRSHAGIPTVITSVQAEPHRGLWSAVHFRVARLEQFSQELER